MRRRIHGMGRLAVTGNAYAHHAFKLQPEAKDLELVVDHPAGLSKTRCRASATRTLSTSSL